MMRGFRVFRRFCSCNRATGCPQTEQQGLAAGIFSFHFPQPVVSVSSPNRGSLAEKQLVCSSWLKPVRQTWRMVRCWKWCVGPMACGHYPWRWRDVPPPQLGLRRIGDARKHTTGIPQNRHMPETSWLAGMRFQRQRGGGCVRWVVQFGFWLLQVAVDEEGEGRL